MSWQSTAVAVTGPVIGGIVGYFGYRRSRHVDSVTQQAGVVTEGRAGTQQIIEALNSLVDNLQEDNKGFRDDIRYLTTRLDAVTTERDTMRVELARLRKRYGNGDDTPAEGHPKT